ncbi:MAG: 3-deoxy-8-phosphooctulonate synthase [Candidatus Omnitrophica bacterium CG1_02_44_16]|nr:MAG: 3-deoxy-8-phosphooctulonate synthase [Candidatus Omnitrophica bacterium CG1_02_44_16]
MKVREVKIGNVTIGGSQPLALIAGPCVIESEKSVLRHAEKLKKLASLMGVPLIFKSSYDKANRTSISSFRGPGLKDGLRILKKVKKEFGLPILSDVHNVEEAKAAGESLDCLQIPAFLCRQTDLLVAAAKTGRAINVKKGQFLSPWNMKDVIKKIESARNHNILLTERGASFGYNNLVVDFRGLDIMRNLGYPVIFDATHSVQLPGASGSCSGGEREYAAALSRAAVAFGCDGLFLEVHERPQAAKCDGPNMISFDSLEKLLSEVVALDRVVLKNKIR